MTLATSSVVEAVLLSVILVPITCVVLFLLAVGIMRKVVTLLGRIYLWTQQDTEQKK